MDEGNLKQDDDSLCSSVLMTTDISDWQPVQMQRPLDRTDQELPLTEEMLMETTENDAVTQLEKSSSNILHMAFVLKTGIDRFNYCSSSSSDLQQQTAFPEQGTDTVFEELEQVGKSPTNSREPSESLQFGEINVDRALRTLKHRSFPIFIRDNEFQMDCMMDAVEPSSAGVERSFSASAFGHKEQLELEMVQVAAQKCHRFEEDQISDSSLTLAANRSLDMSRSLTDRCSRMAELAVSSDDLCSDRLARKRTWKALSIDTPQYNSPKVTEKNLKAVTVEKSSSPFTEQKNLHQAIVDVDHEYNPKSAQRYLVVQEIVETERKYCTSLWILINHFVESLSQSELLKENDINIIFPPCLKQIYIYHGEFFDKLEHRLENWTEFSTVADLFMQLVEAVDVHSQCDLFVQYQTYVDVFPVALLHVRKLCRCNAELDMFVKDLESESCCEGLDVGAFLLTPIQRIPRYVLLLKQLVKCTDDAHPDFVLVDSCLSKLGEFLNQLNKSIKQSMELISADAVPKRKRQFNLAGISFRSANSSNTEGRQSLSLRHQKNSSPPKLNRISLDLSFLGLLKQKKQHGPKDKMVRSELYLPNSLPDQNGPVLSDQLLTSTPLRLTPEPASNGPKCILSRPFKVPKLKRKLKEDPCADLTEDTRNEDLSSQNIPCQGKTGKAVQGNNSLRDFTLRVQVSRNAFLNKFRRRANQELSGFSKNFSKRAIRSVNTTNCDTMEDLCSKTCDKIASCERNIPIQETLDESVWIKPSELIVISDSVLSPDSSKLSADLFATQLSDSSGFTNISNISTHPTDSESSLHSPFQDVNVSSKNESFHTSSCSFRGFFPPKKLRRTDESPKPEPKKMAEVKRKLSVKDVIKNFFVKKGGGKSKIRDQSQDSNN